MEPMRKIANKRQQPPSSDECCLDETECVQQPARRHRTGTSSSQHKKCVPATRNSYNPSSGLQVPAKSPPDMTANSADLMMRSIHDGVAWGGGGMSVVGSTPSSTSASSPSIQDLLVVPLEIIFRQVPSQQQQQPQQQESQSQMTGTVTQQLPPLTSRAATSAMMIIVPPPPRSKPLLSRAEAACLLQLHTLAFEMDTLTAATSQALQQRCSLAYLVHRIERGSASNSSNNNSRNSNPYLWAILPTIRTMGQLWTDQALISIQNEWQRLVRELASAAHQLAHSSEQNWTLAESLWDATGPGSVLATEKRNVSDVQEEVSRRIQHILFWMQYDTKNDPNRTAGNNGGMGNSDNRYSAAAASTGKSPMVDSSKNELPQEHEPPDLSLFKAESMKDYCYRIFGLPVSPSLSSLPTITKDKSNAVDSNAKHLDAADIVNGIPSIGKSVPKSNRTSTRRSAESMHREVGTLHERTEPRGTASALPDLLHLQEKENTPSQQQQKLLLLQLPQQQHQQHSIEQNDFNRDNTNNEADEGTLQQQHLCQSSLPTTRVWVDVMYATGSQGGQDRTTTTTTTTTNNNFNETTPAAAVSKLQAPLHEGNDDVGDSSPPPPSCRSNSNSQRSAAEMLRALAFGRGSF